MAPPACSPNTQQPLCVLLSLCAVFSLAEGDEERLIGWHGETYRAAVSQQVSVVSVRVALGCNFAQSAASIPLHGCDSYCRTGRGLPRPIHRQCCAQPQEGLDGPGAKPWWVSDNFICTHMHTRLSGMCVLHPTFPCMDCTDVECCKVSVLHGACAAICDGRPGLCFLHAVAAMPHSITCGRM